MAEEIDELLQNRDEKLKARLQVLQGEMSLMHRFIAMMQEHIQSGPSVPCYSNKDVRVAQLYLFQMNRVAELLEQCRRGEMDNEHRPLQEIHHIYTTRRGALNALGGELLKRSALFRKHFCEDVGLKMKDALEEARAFVLDDEKVLDAKINAIYDEPLEAAESLVEQLRHP